MEHQRLVDVHLAPETRGRGHVPDLLGVVAELGRLEGQGEAGAIWLLMVARERERGPVAQQLGHDQAPGGGRVLGLEDSEVILDLGADPEGVAQVLEMSLIGNVFIMNELI